MTPIEQQRRAYVTYARTSAFSDLDHQLIGHPKSHPGAAANRPACGQLGVPAGLWEADAVVFGASGPGPGAGMRAMIDSIRSAGTVSYRHFATARELERLLADDLAVLLSESFADATISVGASRPSLTGPGEPDGALPAGTVTACRHPGPEAAGIIQGAAEAYLAESPTIARLISLIVTEALGEEHARQHRARGADMNWDQALAYTLAQTT